MKERTRFSNAVEDSLGSPRPATLKRINMRRFLEELRVRGPSTRADLTRATGVAPPTSSSIIADLLETGWLEAADLRAAEAKGRPGQVYRLATSTVQVLGILIQIDRCVIAPSGLDGIPRLEEAVEFPTPRSYDELLNTLTTQASAFFGAGRRCLGVGLGVPGLVDEQSGRVSLSPNLHYLDGKPLGPDLAGRLEMEVVCTQEEHGLCLAEQQLGGARYLSDFAVLDVSAGMGMGVVSAGRYISGHRGYAGEIGHVTVQPEGRLCGCGNRGCFETVATDTALLNEIRCSLKRDIDLEDALQEALEGRLDVSQELNRTLDFLAIALAAISNLYNPQAIFIHGRILDFGPDALPSLIAKAKARALRPSFDDLSIERAQGNKLYGVLAGVLDSVFAAVGPRLT